MKKTVNYFVHEIHIHILTKSNTKLLFGIYSMVDTDRSNMLKIVL